jgi:hypothetical protein
MAFTKPGVFNMIFSFRITPIASAVLLAFASQAQAQEGVFSGRIERNGLPIVGPATGSMVNLSEVTVDTYVGFGNQVLQSSAAKGNALTGEVSVRSAADGLLIVSNSPDGFQSGVFSPETLTSHITWNTVITNTSSATQQVNFSFYLPGVDLGVSRAYTGYVDGAYKGSADFNAKVTWGGSQVWGLGLGLQASTDNNITPATYVIRTDTSNAPGYATSTYQLNGFPLFAEQALHGEAYTGRLDLGTLASGESRTLSYDLDSSAFYSVNAESDRGAYGGLAWAGATDPFKTNQTFAVTVSAVPEPQTYALLLAGIVVISAVSRRKYSSLQS